MRTGVGARIAEYRITRRLTMTEAASVLGWTDGKHPDRNTLGRLRRIQQAVGVRLVFGGGKQGRTSWTSLSALRHAGLVDDFAELLGETGVELRLMVERIDALEKCVRLMAIELGRLDQRVRTTLVDASTQEIGFREFILPHLPNAKQGELANESKRLPGRPKGARSKNPGKRRKKEIRRRSKKRNAVALNHEDRLSFDAQNAAISRVKRDESPE